MTALGHDRPLRDTDDWRIDAACRTRPDLNWFPEQGQPVAAQLAVCAACPVRTDCLADALGNGADNGYGLWGGLSAKQRRDLRSTARLDINRGPARCGTRSGYMLHRKRQEDACDECRAANAAYQAERVR